MARRSLLLLVALVIGLIGAGAVGLYVSKADSRAQAGQEQKTVLVAKKLIASGTSVADAQREGLFAAETMTATDVPENALTDASAIKGLSAISDIYPGLPLMRAMFAVTNAATGALTVPEGKMAMSVELTDPERVAGFVVPGSSVAIFATFNVKYVGTGPKNGQSDDLTQLLLSKVPVLGVGQESLRSQSSSGGSSNQNSNSDSNSTNSNASDKVPVTVLTVAVTQDEAQRLAHGAQVGKLYFALLSPTSEITPAGAPLDSDTILNGK
jgi:pilus assembly protein CpaB